MRPQPFNKDQPPLPCCERAVSTTRTLPATTTGTEGPDYYLKRASVRPKNRNNQLSLQPINHQYQPVQPLVILSKLIACLSLLQDHRQNHHLFH